MLDQVSWSDSKLWSNHSFHSCGSNRNFCWLNLHEIFLVGFNIIFSHAGNLYSWSISPETQITQDQAELDQQNVASVLASRDFDDRTPLHWAARQGHLEVALKGGTLGAQFKGVPLGSFEN